MFEMSPTEVEILFVLAIENFVSFALRFLCLCSFVNEIASRTSNLVNRSHPTHPLALPPAEVLLRCNYDLSKFLFITNCQLFLYVVQVWLFENGPSRSGVNRIRRSQEEEKVRCVGGEHV
jgi:hypothetical protein